MAGLGPDVGNGLITESPLDYHVFRQEIVSKYPAYHPPKPILSFELARDPVLRSFTINSTTGRTASGGNEYLVFGRKGGGINSGSILKNAVHIVTPRHLHSLPAVWEGREGRNRIIKKNNNLPF